MSNAITCPSCSRQLRVPDNLIDTKVKCPSCGGTFVAVLDADDAEAVELPTVGDEPANRPRSRPVPADTDDDHDIRRPASERPAKVQAIGIMMLIGGILAILAGVSYLGAGLFTCICLAWPGTYYTLVMGILATIRASALLGQQAQRQPPPSGIAVMQIVNIINLDVANCVMGIIELVFLSDPEVRRYFRG